jgi:hypothetical protein
LPNARLGNGRSIRVLQKQRTAPPCKRTTVRARAD